ncbi:MAG: response regulator [Deltaproteobacteria bacterium]|nr:response regulator [Deltaproteobacteria bacterium]
MDYLRQIFSNEGFMPHGHCYLWNGPLVWTMAISDVLIGLAYFAISLSLYTLVRKIKLPFSGIFLAFGLFIAACGATHFMEVLNLWNPYYWPAALLKVITAVASVTTAALMVPLRPKVTKLAQTEATLQKVEEGFHLLTSELEQRVQERTLQYEELINTIDGIVWETPIGHSPYSLVSRQAEKLFGYPLDRWLLEPRFWQGILHPDDRQKLAEAYTGHSVERGDRHLEYRVIAADGRLVWIKDFIRVITENGCPVKLRGLMIDISDRKRVESDLMSVRESALLAASVKSDFLANMSHEIRTPLNAVIGMASLVLDTRLNAKQRDYIDTIKRSGDALLTLINDILDFSKIEAGKLTLEVLDFDIRTLIRNSLELVALSAKNKKIGFSTHLDPEIPFALRGDSGRLLQILINLLSNAVKFTESGDITVSIISENILRDRVILRFEINDTGPGMSQETLEKLFHPFTQGDNSTARKYGGTGLGLSICKRLIDLMNGEIGATSKTGHGSTFWFRVPLEFAQNSIVITAPAQSKPTPPSRRRKAKRILIAEDNAANQKVVQRFLEKLGYGADTVANGQEAVTAIRQKPYDLVLMDCQMPEMDGYQASIKIRSNEHADGRARVPILALTAHALAGDREKCLAAGMDDYLSKPVELTSLDQAVQKWTSASKRRALGSASRPMPKTLTTLDHEYIRQLQDLTADGKPDLFVEVSDIYMHAAADRVEKIKTAFARNDFEALSREAHGMRSTAFSVGARLMSEICENLERLAKNGGPHRSKAELLRALEFEHDEVLRELRLLRGREH